MPQNSQPQPAKKNCPAGKEGDSLQDIRERRVGNANASQNRSYAPQHALAECTRNLRSSRTTMRCRKPRRKAFSFVSHKRTLAYRKFPAKRTKNQICVTAFSGACARSVKMAELFPFCRRTEGRTPLNRLPITDIFPVRMHNSEKHIDCIYQTRQLFDHLANWK